MEAIFYVKRFVNETTSSINKIHIVADTATKHI